MCRYIVSKHHRQKGGPGGEIGKRTRAPKESRDPGPNALCYRICTALLSNLYVVRPQLPTISTAMTERAHQGGLRKEIDEREEVDSRFGRRGNLDAVHGSRGRSTARGSAASG